MKLAIFLDTNIVIEHYNLLFKGTLDILSINKNKLFAKIGKTF